MARYKKIVTCEKKDVASPTRVDEKVASSEDLRLHLRGTDRIVARPVLKLDAERLQTMILLAMEHNRAGNSLQRPLKPKLEQLTKFADLFGLNLRKRLKALVGDYGVEIERLHRAGDYKMARWQKTLAWGYALWYVARGPIDMAVGYVVGFFKVK